ncbi:hypothetical protein Poli38472_008723 [Pythium oligandrum]|uniref:Uncharacterized protein n=1 Tax=Pythium oligandrum TaxID=41045 RepID=A0A8K1C461_PYTOL|nr:hypothetical protein Poli38472_008723 [Pythium oligandrum]|eukprot:TMW56075.1 hypothetical protein Poli38472_008723 [Pythium oligandrum]
MNHTTDTPTTQFPHPTFTTAAAMFEEDDEDEHVFGLSGTFEPALDGAESTSLEGDHMLDDDDQDELFRPSFRDAAHVFTTNALPADLMLQTDSFESNVFESQGKAPVFVLDKGLPGMDLMSHKGFVSSTTPFSPLSPSSYRTNIEVPQKTQWNDFFSVNPTFTSHESPVKIMDTLKAALTGLNCEFEVVQQWSINASCLLVAEELAFSVNLYKIQEATVQYEIEFVFRLGDQLIFTEFTDAIRARCSEVDDDSVLALLAKTMDPWMDATQDLSGRRYSIKEKEASTLIQEINCDYLHTETLYEVAKSIKNHCRHKGNRRLFLQTDRANFVKGLKWMLNDSDQLARFALFVLLQFSKDEEECTNFFSTPYEKSSFSLLLDALLTREHGPRGLCAKFTSSMVEDVRRSALFA